MIEVRTVGSWALPIGDVKDRVGDRDDRRRVRALIEIGRLVARGPDEPAILRHVTEAVAGLLGSPYARLWMLDDLTGDLVLAATAGPLTCPDDVGLRRPASLCNLSMATLEGGRSYQTADVGSDPRWSRGATSERLGLHTYLGVPLQGGARRYGIMTLLFRERRLFDRDELDLLESVATQVTLALRHAHLYTEARTRARQLAAVLDVTRRLALGPNLDEILARITEEAAQLLAVEGAMLRLVEGEELVRAAASGLGRAFPLGDRLRVGESLMGRVVAEDRSIFSADPAGDPRHAPSSRAQAGARGLRWWLGVPLRGRDRVVGALSVFGTGTRRFDASDVGLLEAFAGQAAIAVENARLYAEVQALTLSDPLTGIANRRHFDQKLGEEIARADRDGAPLGLLMVDIDGFKAYNDAHGHQAGDEALRRLAEVLRSAVRSTDFVARYGGEEFGIVLPGTEAEGVHALGEKVRRAVAEAPLGVTISVGGAVRAAGDEGSEAALIAAAGAALYEAKRAGRNLAIVA